jgi:hypothetical protein
VETYKIQSVLFCLRKTLSLTLYSNMNVKKMQGQIPSLVRLARAQAAALRKATENPATNTATPTRPRFSHKSRNPLSAAGTSLPVASQIGADSPSNPSQKPLYP